MTDLWQGLIKAIQLIVTLDREVMEVAGRALAISATSCSIAALISLPLGGFIHSSSFPGKKVLISIIQTFFSLPTVLVGLFVLVLFSRTGPIGGLNLMFTPTLMVIGQIVLVTPLILGLVIAAYQGVSRDITETAISLGANRLQTGVLVLREARYAVMTAGIMGFGRAISEVGLALMVGGNIRGFTRTLTTAISLEAGKGDIELALALGMVLLFIALLINLTLSRLQQK